MKETSIFDYYAFGHDYKLLRSDLNGRTISDALGQLRLLRYNVATLELQVTSKVVSPLDKIVSDLENLDQGEKISETHIKDITKIIERADATLDAELKLKTVISLTPKRFNLEMLLKSPDKLLADGSWGKLTPTAQKDFSEATKCIALNQSTAAAFHLMRAVEELVKQLYFHFVKTKRMEKPMWGPIIQKLSTKNQPRPKKELLEHLDMIRANFRNPTQHPEKFYTIDEAQDLLHSSIVAINKVCEELPSAEQGAAASP
jgi:hypothetical protein